MMATETGVVAVATVTVAVAAAGNNRLVFILAGSLFYATVTFSFFVVS